jgi:sugar lactone lactonase YvrE
VNRTERRWQFPISNFKLATALTLAALLAIAFFVWRWMQPPPELVRLATLGYVESPAEKLYEPFGLAADEDGNIYFTESISGRVFRIAAGSYENNSPLQIAVIAENLQTPSAIAVDQNGNLIVANTGAHTIVRIDPKTQTVSTIAGQAGVSGDADGKAAEARFNAPVGVAVGEDGTIFVADTYNDRIRAIAKDSQVRTIAGGREPGFADGAGAEVRFDTPCGIAVAADGSLLVADTGNRRIRRVESNGQATTLAGNGEAYERNGALLSVSFNEPIAIAVRDKNSFFISDAGGSIRLAEVGQFEKLSRTSESTNQSGQFEKLSHSIKTVLPDLRLNRPAGLAVLPDGELAFAESGSGMIRAMIPADSKLGISFDPDAIALSADRLRKLVEPRWPFDPPDKPREIAGTFGEVRGAISADNEAWFHNGLDVPGAYGELARAIFTEPVTLPLAVEGAGTTRERIRLPLFGYIHVKIGRDKDDALLPNFADGSVTFRRNAEGQITDVRIRRGTLLKAGDAIGSLNRLNHVHLIAGQWGNEFNALSVLRLPGLTDTVAPVIESFAIADEQGKILFDPGAKKNPAANLSQSGRLRIFVRAYDQVNGNAKHRRLGVFRVGYQVLNASGTPLAEFNQTRRNLEFDRLPWDWQTISQVYAEGSQSGYEGPTVFNYIATNVLQRGEIREAFFDPAKLTPGNYTLRVVAADYFGNVAQRDWPITIQQN